MSQSKKLSAGVTRTDKTMSDGRTIRYYDTDGASRNAVDERQKEDQPTIGELRFDSLVNEWVFKKQHPYLFH